jgi:predicted RNA-binding protein with RPS1 domain
VVKVKVLEVDKQGRIRLSMKAVPKEGEGAIGGRASARFLFAR